MKTRAAVLWGTDQQWQVEEITIDPPRVGEVLVEWKVAGMCHSDEHMVTGDMVPPDEALAMMGIDSIFPLIGGHEGAGVVVEVGGPNSRTLRARALIGADGVHSQTRMAVLGMPPATFGNRIAWRALIAQEAGAGLIDMDRATVHMAGGFHLVCYPLPQRRQINLALFMPSRSADAENTQPRITGGGKRVARIVAAATGKWRPWALNTVSLDHWTRGNVALVGDAAHAMVPFQAQGAAMGIEDAAVLAPLLAEKATAAEAFEAYETVRRPRAMAVAAVSARNGTIFHLPWPASLGRDLVMRAQGSRGHLRRLGWIYGHDAAAGAMWEP